MMFLFVFCGGREQASPFEPIKGQHLSALALAYWSCVFIPFKRRSFLHIYGVARVGVALLCCYRSPEQTKH